MSCDIHFKLEYKPKDKDVQHWFPVFGWSQNELYLDADYMIFAALANVRNYDDIEHIELKGFPKDADLSTKLAYCYVIDESEESNTTYYDSEDGTKCVNPDVADNWVNQKYSVYMEDPIYGLVTGPDFHSANWCTFEEYKHALDIVKNKYPNKFINVCYQAIYALMETYNKNDMYIRMVYWFDN
ncbi:MAG: hypothetical protein [Wendovervirus sonii]|uniref:Uncharacterized protein n=1 Tax=phage Lak_Megaphage_Sonny TaxID=3109229 RepID=A0ABZ0Z2M6_9CAUD|nr:MAG: hypothetical protein [phage Lak_Megaphage_Sonny]